MLQRDGLSGFCHQLEIIPRHNRYNFDENPTDGESSIGDFLDDDEDSELEERRRRRRKRAKKQEVPVTVKTALFTRRCKALT